MVDLVEKAIQVDVHNNQQIAQFFQYLQHIAYQNSVHISLHNLLALLVPLMC